MILATKLYALTPRPGVVYSPRLTERLDGSLRRRLTLISASADSGKTTLVGEWVSGCDRPVVWPSLDEGDKDRLRVTGVTVS